MDRHSLVTLKDALSGAFGFHDDIPTDLLTALFCPPFPWHVHPNRCFSQGLEQVKTAGAARGLGE